MKIVLCMLAFLSLQAKVVEAQTAADRQQDLVRADLLSNVVKIASNIGGGQQGYGLIIGREFDRLYVATARHILSEEFIYGDPGAPSLRVRFHRLNETWQALPGRITSPQEPSDLDLAIIEVDVPRFDRGDGVTPIRADHWREKVIDDDPRIGASAELMADVQTIGYAGGDGRVSLVEGGKVVAFDNLRGIVGQSGAPIVTDRGIVGIHLGTRVPPFVTVQEIAKVVATELGPGAFQLKPVEPLPSPANVCVSIQKGSHELVAITGPNGRLTFNDQGCVETLSGQHQVHGMFVSCEPKAFAVRPTEQLHLRVTCAPVPDGMWIASGFGFLNVQPSGSNRWEFEGNLPQSRGEIKGRFEGSIPRLSLAASLLRGRIPLSGFAIVEERTLRLDLFAEGEFFEEEYVRP